MRVAAIMWCQQIPNLQVYLFRRLSPDLIKTHIEGPKGFKALLAPWERVGLVEIVEDEIRFNWNGSKIYLCHCQEEEDKQKYRGMEMHVLLIDELTEFTEGIYRFIRSRVRMDKDTQSKIPADLQGKFPRIFTSSNPSGVGHSWVKRTFIDPVPHGDAYRASDDEGGFIRQYIPARLEDNPSIDEQSYRATLKGMGDEALVRAMELGDWSVVEGAFFSEFQYHKHVIEPFTIPETWPRFRSFDWGSFRPAALNWWAMSDGSTIQSFDPHTGYVVDKQYPRGALICYREWYVAKAANEGLGLNTEQLAKEALKRQTPTEHFLYSVADPSIWKVDGGESIRAKLAKAGLVFNKKGDRERIPGWQSVKSRLIGDNNEPMLLFFKNCTDSIRLLPETQRDRQNPEDIDTGGEDHVLDSIRYMCMTKPYKVRLPERKQAKNLQTLTMNDLWADHKRKLQKRAKYA